MSKTYHPRNDFVVIKAEKVGLVRGLEMPQTSAESERYVVQAVGPKVEGLQPGDVVLVIGEKGLNWSMIPRERDLFVTREENIIMKVTEDGE